MTLWQKLSEIRQWCWMPMHVCRVGRLLMWPVYVGLVRSAFAVYIRTSLEYAFGKDSSGGPRSDCFFLKSTLHRHWPDFQIYRQVNCRLISTRSFKKYVRKDANDWTLSSLELNTSQRRIHRRCHVAICAVIKSMRYRSARSAHVRLPPFCNCQPSFSYPASNLIIEICDLKSSCWLLGGTSLPQLLQSMIQSRSSPSTLSCPILDGRSRAVHSYVCSFSDCASDSPLQRDSSVCLRDFARSQSVHKFGVWGSNFSIHDWWT